MFTLRDKVRSSVTHGELRIGAWAFRRPVESLIRLIYFLKELL